MIRLLFSIFLFVSCANIANSQVDTCNVSIEYFVNIFCDDEEILESIIQVQAENSTSGSYDVYQNGILLHTFPYSESSDTFNIINAGNSSEIVVCDQFSSTCCDTLNVLNSCVCALYEMDYYITSCDDEDSSFYLTIDFDYFMPADSFELGGGGNNFGTHAYVDLPIEIGPFDFDSLDYEIVVFDKLDAFCFNSIQPGIITACDTICFIQDLFVELTECSDEGFFYVDFELNSTLDEGEFIFSADGIAIDTFTYGSEFYSAGPINTDCVSLYTFDVQDISESQCSDSFSFEEPVCCVEVECSISNTTVEVTDCGVQGIFYLEYSFDSNQTEGQFEFILDGMVVDTFNYGEDLYVSGSFESDCSTLHQIIIQDLSNNLCQDTFQFDEPICCTGIGDCDLSNFFATASDCNEDETFDVEFTFEFAATTSDSFHIELDELVIATLPYGEESYTLTGFDGDCETEYKFLIRDYEDVDCISNFALLGTICCEVIDTCSINDITFDILPCDDNGQFLVSLDFILNNNTESDSFIVSGNGTIYDTLPYGDSLYLIGPLEGDCETTYEFILTDILDNQCTSFVEFDDFVCCNVMDTCIINNIVADISSCDENDQFLVDLSFFTDQTEGMFTVAGNGVVYDTFTYGMTNYSIGPLDGDCSTIYEFILTDFEDSSCTSFIEFQEVICCVDLECEVTALNITQLECDNAGNFSVEVFAEADNSISNLYQLEVSNGESYIFDYGVTDTIVLLGDCSSIYSFVVTDVDHADCQADFAFDEAVCCEIILECQINDLEVVSLNCFEDNYILSYTFNHVNTSEIGYDIYINEIFNSFKPYDPLPSTIIIDNISPEDTIATLTICDNDNLDCCDTLIIDLTNCDNDPCTISDIEITYSECIEDMFNILLDFEFSNNMDSFSVVGNGVEYGNFNYNDLPIDLGPFEGDSTFVYELIIEDFSENCISVNEFNGIECTGSGAIDSNLPSSILSINQNTLIIKEGIRLESLSVFGIDGRKISTENNVQNRVDLSKLDLGIYIILFHHEGTIYSQKVFIN